MCSLKKTKWSRLTVGPFALLPLLLLRTVEAADERDYFVPTRKLELAGVRPKMLLRWAHFVPKFSLSLFLRQADSLVCAVDLCLQNELAYIYLTSSLLSFVETIIPILHPHPQVNIVNQVLAANQRTVMMM